MLISSRKLLLCQFRLYLLQKLLPEKPQEAEADLDLSIKNGVSNENKC